MDIGNVIPPPLPHVIYVIFSWDYGCFPCSCMELLLNNGND
ncbi:hypothetical protein HMPREF9997_00704 [Corynebacterium durum F0235]|uniref:Uncharacterized protein n=1 Tax=Corynebacterium durum F0235 TaxID=1035195 RepID=L1MKQ3_9CORY|nr:hypothetical protein HMPREF9997_00704 [Corynebacterium durum F0235]